MSASRRRAAPLVACPVCGKSARYEPANAWRPFCSERCKQIDLGRWASESYRVAGEPAEDAAASDDPSGA